MKADAADQGRGLSTRRGRPTGAGGSATLDSSCRPKKEGQDDQG